MKVLIRFSKEVENSSLETDTYLSNLVKSLEKEGITVSTNILTKCEIAHFISPAEEKQINDAYLDDLLVVISVGYSEGDEKNRFFDYSNPAKPTLTPRVLKILKEADLLLVPSEIIKENLISNGVENKIDVVTTGVNINTYSSINSGFADIFKKYQKNRTDRKYVIAKGSGDKNEIASLSKIAKGVPSVDFYYLTDLDKVQRTKNIAKRGRKIIESNNLHIIPTVQYDLFLSAIYEASAYISLSAVDQDYLTILCAFAAKTQVIYMDNERKHGLLVNKENILTAANEEKAQRIIFGLCNKENTNIINNAYEFAKANDLSVMGKQLKNSYQQLMK